jgi:hypothetical protein
LTLEDGTDRLSRNVRKYQYTLRNIIESEDLKSMWKLQFGASMCVGFGSKINDYISYVGRETNKVVHKEVGIQLCTVVVNILNASTFTR